jgi:hypothetical protein
MNTIPILLGKQVLNGTPIEQECASAIGKIDGSNDFFAGYWGSYARSPLNAKRFATEKEARAHYEWCKNMMM